MTQGNPISRRKVLVGGAALAGAATLPGLASASIPGKPNIIFILADDLGAFDLSCYGRPDYRTPHIDSLARDGIKFRYGYSSSASCTPTRVGLISGRYPNRVPVGTVEGGGATSSTVGYAAEWPSMARTFKDAGYRTSLIGKWNLGPLPNFSPLKCGYEEFFGFTGGAIDYWSHDLGMPFIPNAARTHDLYDNDIEVRPEGYSTDLFTQRACQIIARQDDRPFFISLHYSAPHWPWQSATDAGPPRSSDFHFDGGSMALYAEMMRSLDDSVGQVLATLEENGLAGDTIVIFTSDNGGERFSFMWPLRGAKNDLLEGGIRVPVLVRWPNHIVPGSETGQVALSMDWLPTLAAMAGVQADSQVPLDGIDLSSQLLGAAPLNRSVYWKTPRASASLAFPWKYLRDGEREFLFNLLEDESENSNFKLHEAEIFASLQAATARHSAEMLPSPQPANPDGIENMRSLDYRAPPPRRG